MMSFIRPIVSVFLAAVVLIASIGVTVNLHLCAGKIQSVALYAKAQPCEDVKMPCHGKAHHSKQKGCCEEESIVLKGKEVNAEVRTPGQITPSFSLIAVILPVLYTIIEGNASTPISKYACYKPPLVERDINVLVQSFLI
jgi:hypothetical protein